ncbi:MAG TPA: acyl-CoA dehydrogenase family protein [Candidatus Hydrogenedentes bacterium]|nr:acyl-CoA dehydrogenase family protein [Candidatus Hydrogenedentota bacterium]HPG66140.1 acyl-CoA dehydrogenase family protein [Candidatus Hydrogenedentota bacterium]
MDFRLTEEQRDIQQMARKFARNEIAPRAAGIDRAERFPIETFKQMGDLGLLGLLVPEEYGGSGQSVLTCCVVGEEIAYACGSTALSYLAHAVLCCHNLSCNGSDEQKRKYLPDLASGAKLGALAMTEPSAGSDVLALETFGERHGDEYLVNGSKTFITNAPVADTFLVYVRTDKKAGPRGISQFIVEKDFPGCSVGQPFHKMGMRGSPTAELFFQDCRVPAENLVKGENKALGILMGGLDVERTVGGSMGVGLARAVFDRALAYAKERQQFGQPLIMFEMVAEKIANMSVDIEAARLLTYKAATLCDEGIRCSAEASYAKLFASEMCLRAASEAVQILGGYGYTEEYEVERMLRDARLGTIGGGASEIQRLIIAREVVKRSMQGGNE